MRIGHAQPSFPSYFDRSAVRIGGAYIYSTYAPHALTTRFTYTVPANKLAYVEYIGVYVERFTAPSTAGHAMARISYYVNGVVGPFFLLAARLNSPTVGEVNEQYQQAGFVIYASDTIVAETSDASTGGMHAFQIYAKIIEFA